MNFIWSISYRFWGRWTSTTEKRVCFTSLFTWWKQLLPAKQHPTQCILKKSKRHNRSLCKHHGYLCGHKKHSIEEHKIMPWYCQMIGLLECEDNWPQQGYLGRVGHLQPFISFWFPTAFYQLLKIRDNATTCTSGPSNSYHDYPAIFVIAISMGDSTYYFPSSGHFLHSHSQELNRQEWISLGNKVTGAKKYNIPDWRCQ